MIKLNSGRSIWKILALVIFLLIAVKIFFFSSKPTKIPLESNYSITNRADFNQPDYYDLQQKVSPEIYQPTGNWVGRLILPTQEEINASNSLDWVWLEVYHAAKTKGDLIGKKVIVTWQDLPEIQSYVKLVTTDIKFSDQAKEGLLEGNVLPIRLNGRSRVGPLQSLAGARDRDDVIVSLEDVKITQDKNNHTVLQISTSPLQVTGRFYGLVKIIKSISNQEKSSICPEKSNCPSNLYQVIHYNHNTGKFDGIKEIIRLPQQPLSRDGRYNFTPDHIENSPANVMGWYIYGDKDHRGIFTVQSLKPRMAFQIKTNRLITGKKAGLHYIDLENWENTKEKKGLLNTVLIEPNPDKNYTQWRQGDSGLVVHNFGGIGGKKGELGFLTFPTGHFAYGIAKVIREPLTGELQFDVQYEQIYAHNPDGIIASKTSWQTYAGNLQRGWMPTRPISDVIVDLNWLNQYLYKNVGIDPIGELLLQTEIMMARYRTGDGTGISVVSPGTSCVQDSMQAFYIMMQKIKQQLQNHSLKDDPISKEFTALADALENEIIPFGIIRPDWQKNINTISGINQRTGQFFRFQDVRAALLTWQSMIPRRAADQMSRLFFEHGSSLNFIRTNEVGGYQSDIYPVPPTLINGLPLISVFLTRLILAFYTKVTPYTWWITVQSILLYALVSLPIGFASGFFRWKASLQNLRAQIVTILVAIFTPGLSEEIVFRVLLIPHRLEKVTEPSWILAALISLILFTVYHPIIALTTFRRANPTFFNPVFLLLAALLGIVCTISYFLTGSIWPSVIVHSLAVIIWLLLLDGSRKLNPLRSHIR